MNIQPIQVDLGQQDWKLLLKKPLPQREHYQNGEPGLVYDQVAGRFLGCLDDKDAYFESLYDLVYESDSNLELLSETIDKTISNDTFRSIQKIMNIHQAEKGLSVNRFVAFMEGEALLPIKEKSDYYRYFRSCYINLLNQFESRHPKGLFDPNFRRVVVDTVKWSWNHIDKWLKTMDVTQEVPRVIWYGDATESQSYFLYFLILLGFDVLIYHPEGKDVLEAVDGKVTPIERLPSQTSLRPFPKTRPQRKSTVARRASVEMDEVLHSENSLLFKPWQFRDYAPEAITLKTTYDEVFLIAREKAFIRPNFEAKHGTVFIPTLFSKIHGLSTNRKEYWSRLQELKDAELTEVITRFPFTSEIRGSQLFHYREALRDGVLDPEVMMNGNWWRYKSLPEGLQLGLAKAISRYVEKATFKKMDHESHEDLRLFLFTVALEIPENLLKLIQQFDYSQSVPKLILFNNGSQGRLSRQDAALLVLMNELGFDVVCYNPTGENDLEFYLDQSLFDSHWLEEVSFNESFEEHVSESGSLFKKLIDKFL